MTIKHSSFNFRCEKRGTTKILLNNLSIPSCRGRTPFVWTNCPRFHPPVEPHRPRTEDVVVADTPVVRTGYGGVLWGGERKPVLVHRGCQRLPDHGGVSQGALPPVPVAQNVCCPCNVSWCVGVLLERSHLRAPPWGPHVSEGTTTTTLGLQNFPWVYERVTNPELDCTTFRMFMKGCRNNNRTARLTMRLKMIQTSWLSNLRWCIHFVKENIWWISVLEFCNNSGRILATR